jgi:outer membrane protein OmpA-like peptidoglycan-associated protein
LQKETTADKGVTEEPAPGPGKTQKSEPAISEVSEQKSVFESLSTIEIQSADDEMISVGDKLVLNNVFFYSNTYAFKPEATEELDQLYGFLTDNPTIQLEIHGHTANNAEDIRPDPNFKNQGPEWNFKGSALKLSEMRAKAVEVYLVEKGIQKKRLRSVGFGDSQKRIPEASTFEDSEKNMRVEALVVKQ